MRDGLDTGPRSPVAVVSGNALPALAAEPDAGESAAALPSHDGAGPQDGTRCRLYHGHSLRVPVRCVAHPATPT